MENEERFKSIYDYEWFKYKYKTEEQMNLINENNNYVRKLIEVFKNQYAKREPLFYYRCFKCKELPKVKESKAGGYLIYCPKCGYTIRRFSHLKYEWNESQIIRRYL